MFNVKEKIQQLSPLWSSILGGLTVLLLVAIGIFVFWRLHRPDAPTVPDLKVPSEVNTKVGLKTILKGESKGPSISWKLLDGPAPSLDVTLLDIDSHTVYFFAPAPGDYHIVASAFVSKKVTLSFITIHVSPYGPAPGPGPNPTPVLPDGKFKLASTVYKLVMDKVNLPADQRAANAKSLATSFRGIASAISAGTITKLEDVLTKTKSSNNSALGQNVSSWDAFGNELKSILFKLYSTQKINVPADFAVAWNEIAAGLEAVK